MAQKKLWQSCLNSLFPLNGGWLTELDLVTPIQKKKKDNVFITYAKSLQQEWSLSEMKTFVHGEYESLETALLFIDD